MKSHSHIDAPSVFIKMYKQLAGFLVTTGLMMGCFTTSRSQLVTNLNIERSRPNSNTKYVLDQTLSQEFYLKILKQEVESGFSLDNKYTHSNNGLILCARHPSANGSICYLYGFLTGKITPSFISDINQETSDALLDHFTPLEKKNGASDPIFIDLFCNYFGKSNPPFGVEEAVCYLDNYRLSKQVYLTKTAAQDLMSRCQITQGKIPEIQTSKGVVRCQWNENLNRMSCQVVQGQVSNDNEPLSPLSTYYLTRQFSPKSFAESRNQSIDSLLKKVSTGAFTIKVECDFYSRDQEYTCSGVVDD